MKKVMICLIGCFLFALTTLRAQDSAKADSARSSVDTTKQTQGGSVISRDTTASTPRDTTIQVRDTTKPVTDTVISLADDPAPVHDTTMYASSHKDKPDAAKDVAGATPAGTDQQAGVTPPATGAAAAKDTATKEDKAEETTRKLDTRWFISPLLKFQFQDFAMLEKNRKGYLSDANTLPFFKRGNASFAASAYKNLTQRLSISADLGLSFGHVTNDNVLISQTKSKTFNLLNAALYYHLLAPSYRLQPYVTVGINDVINDASYASIPMGIGAKFNARKVMVTGQITYGYAMGKSISNTTMYSVGIYLPIKNKKQKQLDQEDNSPYNRKKDDKKDTANKNNGSVVNNIFITINMDSVLKAKGLLDDNGNPIGGRGVNDGDDDGRGGGGSRAKRARPFRSMGLDDFSDDDYKIDSLDGRPVLRFVVYFEFNEYGLTTKAFNNIDKVIGHLRKTTEFNVEIKGYTDSIGTNAYNNMLSRRRAKMVLDYMNSRGVPTELMKAKAYGSDDPVGDNRDPNQAWLNRRAEIIIHQKEFTASTAAEK